MFGRSSSHFIREYRRPRRAGKMARERDSLKNMPAQLGLLLPRRKSGLGQRKKKEQLSPGISRTVVRIFSYFLKIIGEKFFHHEAWLIRIASLSFSERWKSKHAYFTRNLLLALTKKKVYLSSSLFAEGGGVRRRRRLFKISYFFSIREGEETAALFVRSAWHPSIFIAGAHFFYLFTRNFEQWSLRNIFCVKQCAN